MTYTRPGTLISAVEGPALKVVVSIQRPQFFPGTERKKLCVSWGLCSQLPRVKSDADEPKGAPTPKKRARAPTRVQRTHSWFYETHKTLKHVFCHTCRGLKDRWSNEFAFRSVWLPKNAISCNLSSIEPDFLWVQGAV